MSVFLHSNEQLSELVPNIVLDCQGEDSLLDKINPWADQADEWLTQKILADRRLASGLEDHCAKLVAHRALASALPALDLVLTPTGFAVVSSDELAPASKERVERLADSLLKSANDQAMLLVSKLILIPEWRSSPQGLIWSSSLMNNPSVAEIWADQNDKARFFDFACDCARYAADFCSACAQHFIDQGFIDAAIAASAWGESYSGIHAADLRAAAQPLAWAQCRFVADAVKGRGRLSIDALFASLQPFFSSLRKFPQIIGAWPSLANAFHENNLLSSKKGALWL